MEDVNEYSNTDEFAEGSKINALELKTLNFPWIQKQMKEEDFVLSHIPMKSQ
uniref:Uncharacterized protein n=1 Tax=Cebus imitator TaxID=2715852 RepID=A0A2K5PPK3_CEBIM